MRRQGLNIGEEMRTLSRYLGKNVLGRGNGMSKDLRPACLLLTWRGDQHDEKSEKRRI